MSVILALLIASQLLQFGEPKCLLQHLTWKDKCLTVIDGYTKSWADGQRVCSKEKGRLLDLESYTYSEISDLFEPYKGKEFWVGARKQKAWYWSNDGTTNLEKSQEIVKSFWGDNEPNFNILAMEDRISLYKAKGYRWNDESHFVKGSGVLLLLGDGYYKALCECSVSACGSSKNITRLLDYGGQRYFTTRESYMSWGRAWTECMSYNAKLVKIENEDLQLQLQKELPYHGDYHYWTAGYWRKQKQMSFTWNSGKALQGVDTSSAFRADDELCVTASSSSSKMGIFRAMKCDRKISFVCEFDQELTTPPHQVTTAMLTTSTPTPQNKTPSLQMSQTTIPRIPDTRSVWPIATSTKILSSVAKTVPPRSECVSKNISRILAAGQTSVDVEVGPDQILSLPVGVYVYRTQNCTVHVSVREADNMTDCPAQITGTASWYTGLGSLRLDCGSVIHSLRLPVGVYKYDTYRSGGYNCSMSLKISDYRLLRQMVFRAKYDVKCALLSEPITKETLPVIAESYFGQITGAVCGGDCNRMMGSQARLDCANDTLSITWPTDRTFKGEVTEIPADLLHRLTDRLERLKANALAPVFKITIFTPVYKVIEPAQTEIMLTSNCLNNMRYEKNTDSCQ